VTLSARLSDDWGTYDNVGASVKCSLPRVSATCPPGHQVAFFLRYQLPNAPEHVLKEGVFTAVFGNPTISAPTVTTKPATNVRPTQATFNGTANPRGQATTVYFQWGTTTSYGKTTPAQAVSAGTTDINVSATISGLAKNREYHYRAVATNASGTRVGADVAFRTPKR
jgi:hypothetical protein